MLQQAVENVSQHFVRAIADEHLLRCDAVMGGDGGLELFAVRVRIEFELIADGRAHGLQRLGRRAVGVFIGVELDQIGELGLLAGT